MESNTIHGNTEETEKKINEICSMSWLKRSSQSPSENKNCMEIKEIVPKSQIVEDYIAGTKTGKKRKPKRSKAASVNASKDANSKNSDTDTEQSSRKHGKRNSTVLPITALTVSSSNTVWNAKTNAASALFPGVQSQKIEILNEDVLLTAALEESILTAQLEQFKLTPEETKVNWADESEDPGWSTTRHNLPEPFEDNDKDTEKKLEKKSHDDNNNSNNKSSNAKDQDLKGIDKYGRIGGFTERHLFMGRGARVKEQQIIGQQNNRGFFNRRSPIPMQEKSDCEFFSRNDSYENRNRGQRDFGERNSNDNRSSNFDDRREYRNKNFQFSNQRGRFDNQSHRYDNHPNRYDNQPHRSDNHPHRYENQAQRYNNQQQRCENQPQRYENHPQRYDSQQQRYDNQQQRYNNQPNRYDNHRFSNNQRRDFQNRDQNQDLSFHKREFSDNDSNKLEDNKEHSTRELSYDENTTENQHPPEREEEKLLKKSEIESVKQDLSRSSTPIVEDSSSLCFLQESFKDEEKEICETPVRSNEQVSETTSEQRKYQEKQTTSTNPFQMNIRPISVHVLHPPGIMSPNSEGSVQMHNGMPYNMMTNPFMTPVPSTNPPHFQHQHIQEIVPSESGCTAVPIQNLDIRFFPQHPVVQNHPVNSFMPIANYPMGMPLHSCAQIPQIPVGNTHGMNFMQQHPVNCQQCPPHYCQSQRIPLQNLNCQNSIYPAQFMPPMTSLAVPMAPMVNLQQIIPQSGKNPQPGKNPHSDKVEITPATEIGRSVSNLVSLCENLPSSRRSYSNCPPGFENNAATNPNAAQKKIIFDKEQAALPSFRNNPKQSAQADSRKTSKKTEEFTDEKLADIYQEINMSSKSKEKEDVNSTSMKWPEQAIKFSQDSYHEQLLKSYLDIEEKPSKSNNQAPRPGFRMGVGRGKRLGHTT